MKAQGFDYVPGGPVRAAAGADRQGAAERRGVHQAVRLRHQHAVRPRQRAVRSQRADPQEPRPRPTAPPTIGRCGGDNPGVTFAEAVDSGDFTELGGCTKQATEAVFGGAGVLSSLVGEARRARRAHRPGPAHGEGRREVVRLHAGQGLPLRGAGRRSTSDLEERFKAIVGSGRQARRDHARPPGASYDRPRSPRCSARRSRSPTPTWSARSRRSRRSSTRSARSTRRRSARRTSRLLARVKPA